MRDEDGSEVCEVGVVEWQHIVKGGAADGADAASEVLLHGRRGKEAGWQEDAGCRCFFVADGRTGGSLS